MKIVRIKLGDETSYGILDGEVVRLLKGDPYGGIEPGPRSVPVEEVRMLCPVEPRRIFGVGTNYHATAAALGRAIPERPLLFMKPSTAAIGPDESILYPQGSSDVVFEGEMAVVIGKGGRNISEADALDCVLGFTCGNDLTEREIQRAELKAGSMMLSKAFDTFNPLGPVIATGINPDALELEVLVNGVFRQKGNTSDQIFGARKLIALVSRAITLLPGDVIMTGTPPGLGPVVPGDLIEIAIPEIGTLRNTVVRDSR